MILTLLIKLFNLKSDKHYIVNKERVKMQI